jgi:hypothetical protein
MSAMTQAELNAILDRDLALAESARGAASARERRVALAHYRGDPFGNEVEGRSQVVSRDVAETIDATMPSLMRIFASGEEVVRFEPVGPEDEAAAAQASDYVNWIFSQQNAGFRILHDWFKDALLYRLGIVKVWWEKQDRVEREAYRMLTPAEADALSGDPEVTVLAREMCGARDRLPPLVDLDLQRRTSCGRVRVANVPPEEFLFDPQAACLEDAAFVVHRVRRRAGELLAQGYSRELVDKLPSASGLDRSRRGPMREFPVAAGPALDPARREIELEEWYVRLDRDGEGTLECRRVLRAVSVILENEPADGQPFAVLTPVPMPHTLVGRSLADQTMDLQLVKSTLWRQALDNLYLANNRRVEVVEGQVNLDDLMTSRPGGIVRVRQAGAVRPLDFTPLGGAAFQMIEYLDTVREARTGITRYNQGLSADTLNKTATGVGLLLEQGAQRIELLARVFAETGVKQLFRRILSLVQRYQDRPAILRLRNRWVEMDPRSWRPEMDTTVAVGLGTGNRQRMLEQMLMLLSLDERIVQLQGGLTGPLVTLENVHAKLAKLVEAAGLKSVGAFYSDPAAYAPGAEAPKPDPRVAQAAVEFALEARRAEAEIGLERAKAGARAALDREKLAAEVALKGAAIAAELALAAEKRAAPERAGT